MNAIRLSEHVSVVLHRTLRIPDDGHQYPLPPGLGAFPVHDVRTLRSAPCAWRERGGYVVPIHQCEALWLGFTAPYHKPHALKVGIGGVDAISGKRFKPARLAKGKQNYVVIPEQPWLDGINAGDGFIRQFVAVRLGDGATVEGQLTGEETEGGLQLRLFAPKPGRFPDRPTRLRRVDMCFAGAGAAAPAPACQAADMGLGAGGRMRQQIFADKHGIDTWQPKPTAKAHVRLVDAHDFARLTGLPVPPTPVDVETYIRHGLPWFDLYAPDQIDIEKSKRLAGVKSVDAVLDACA